ncbi:MAG TPA: DUF5818 domain-containing protein [Terriglobia bacterium]|nr:DUF5818 domain-containing protein [Terriglobia bacterium]
MFTKVNSRVFLAILSLGVALFSANMSVIAQPADHLAATTCWLSAEQPKADNGSTPSEADTFTGKIVKSGDMVVLVDTSSRTTYQLDDQDKAQPFVGKNVKVTGTLDVATNVIHITEIEPAA